MQTVMRARTRTHLSLKTHSDITASVYGTDGEISELRRFRNTTLMYFSMNPNIKKNKLKLYDAVMYKKCYDFFFSLNAAVKLF